MYADQDNKLMLLAVTSKWHNNSHLAKINLPYTNTGQTSGDLVSCFSYHIPPELLSRQSTILYDWISWICKYIKIWKFRTCTA